MTLKPKKILQVKLILVSSSTLAMFSHLLISFFFCYCSGEVVPPEDPDHPNALLAIQLRKLEAGTCFPGTTIKVPLERVGEVVVKREEVFVREAAMERNRFVSCPDVLCFTLSRFTQQGDFIILRFHFLTQCQSRRQGLFIFQF